MKPILSNYSPQWLKSWVKRTMSYASDSYTYHHRAPRDEDQMELTLKSKRNEIGAVLEGSASISSIGQSHDYASAHSGTNPNETTVEVRRPEEAARGESWLGEDPEDGKI